MKRQFRVLGRHLLQLDWLALACTVLLLGLGVLFIYSTSVGETGGSWWKLQWVRQILFALIGLGGYLAVALFDYRNLKELSPLLYSGSLLLLVGVLIFGKERNGSRSWYDLGVVDFQPSELAKIGLILALAAFLNDPQRSIRSPRPLLLAFALCGLPTGLILLQPDLGSAMILPCILFAILFVAGLSWRVMLLLGLMGILMLPAGWALAKDYQKERVMVFLNPDRDPLGAGWNMKQSRMAVGSGGLNGKGLRQGTQNVLGYLPDTVAPTDFIFSVIAEETGFVGCILVLSAYVLMFFLLARTALLSLDLFGRYVVVGVLAMLFVHVSINVAMTIGLMPIVGLPLPLVSYGGSFIVTLLLALGLAQSVHVRRNAHSFSQI